MSKIPKLKRGFLDDKFDHDLINLPASSDQLQSSISPALKHQILSILPLFDLSDSPEDPNKLLESLLEISRQLFDTFEQLCLCLLPPDAFEDPVEKCRIEDSPMKAMAKFKYQRVTGVLIRIGKSTSRLMKACCRLVYALHQNGLVVPENSSQNQNRFNPHLSKRKGRVETYTHESLNMIDRLNQLLGQSECSIIQEEWQATVRFFTYQLESTATLTKIQQKKQQKTRPREWHNSQRLSKKIEAAKWAGTLLKLSRMFLNKLSPTKMNTEFLKMISQMDSKQLVILRDNTEPLFAHFLNLMETFHDDFEFDYDDPESETPFQIISCISDCFQSCIPVLLAFLDSLPPQPDRQIHLHKTWVEVWNHQFSSVIEKLIEAIGLMDW